MSDPQYKTEVIRVDGLHPEETLLRPAALALRRGELVAFPTETVYGLGANAMNPQAVARIFAVKGRPPDNPLIVHSADIAGLEPLVRTLSPLARKLLLAFAPGPLTLVLPRSARVPAVVTAGLDTVAVRIPDHPVAHSLLDLAGIGVAAPSANRSGRPSPTLAWHVLQDLDGRIPYLIDGGPCRYGLESTVVDLSGDRPVILRPGSVTAEAISRVTGIEAVMAATGRQDDGTLQETDGQPRAPGMKYRHYAPKARVIIAEVSNGNDAGCNMAELMRPWLSRRLKVGIYACDQTIGRLGMTCEPLTAPASSDRADAAAQPACFSLSYGPVPDPAMAGRALFDALRLFDAAHCDVIVAEGLPETGVGAAYMNRLRKAAHSDAEPPHTGV